jgi:hypothetical protein
VHAVFERERGPLCVAGSIGAGLRLGGRTVAHGPSAFIGGSVSDWPIERISIDLRRDWHTDDRASALWNPPSRGEYRGDASITAAIARRYKPSGTDRVGVTTS